MLKAFAQAAVFLRQGQLPDTGEARTPPATLKEGLRARGLCLLCPTESGYVEQLFQFLQATAQEDGFFGESQAARWYPGGRGRCWWLLPSAGP